VVSSNINRPPFAVILVLAIELSAALVGCGGDGGSEAQRRGVGAACAGDPDCKEGLTCLAFKGGYCGLAECQHDAGCPAGSACVAHSDGKNYCFLVCTDKPQCNLYRTADEEANCSSSVTFIEATNVKACVPPSG
jgi:hypothetical protein